MPALNLLYKFCIYKTHKKCKHKPNWKSHTGFFTCLIFCGTNYLRLRANCLLMIHTKCYTINWAALISINQIVIRTKGFYHFSHIVAHTHTQIGCLLLIGERSITTTKIGSRWRIWYCDKMCACAKCNYWF